MHKHRKNTGVFVFQLKKATGIKAIPVFGRYFVKPVPLTARTAAMKTHPQR